MRVPVWLSWFLLIAVCLLLALQFWALRRKPDTAADPMEARLAARFDELARASERMERELRAEVAESGRGARTELLAALGQFQLSLSATHKDMASLQSQEIEKFGTQFGGQMAQWSASMQQQLAALSESNARRLNEVREAVDGKLKEIQSDNAIKLEEMRRTVDEKLHATLEERLGQSFKLVSERLEAVHKGLGEMQLLAAGVGDLKRVLTNVKSRGGWGEMQLSALLEQLLTADQFAANVETVPGSGKRVEFAIKLPGKEGTPVWLPIDAKFPKEQYERLVEAADAGDAPGVLAASKELEDAILQEAKVIASKYVLPPLTTDFALMFLPTEGLYAEVLRRPGLSDRIQREYRVTIAGPTTLTALLNSLQMGFRTLAIEKRSSEVWEVLGAVKSEFELFGKALATVKSNLQATINNIEKTETRTRQMQRKLKTVEALPSADAERLLQLGEEPEA
jgi:DNA recombination protein RmuC